MVINLGSPFHVPLLSDRSLLLRGPRSLALFGERPDVSLSLLLMTT